MALIRDSSRYVGAGVGAIAIVAMGVLSACSDEGMDGVKKGVPSTSSTVSPTEKHLDSRGGNSFAPNVPATTTLPAHTNKNTPPRMPPPRPGPPPGP
ncbi:MAG TPA: hypothetical protein PKK01_08615, partial [Mycobacterium sp.]|nr:hypothetical protein [Mycobacterium sp.]